VLDSIIETDDIKKYADIINNLSEFSCLQESIVRICFKIFLALKYGYT